MGDDDISGVFGDNNFWACSNELVVKSRWSGTAAYELFIRNMEVSTDTGEIVHGDRIGINYLQASQIIPLTYENQIMTEVAFASDKVIGGKQVTVVSVYLLVDGLYEITNLCFDKNGVCIDKDGFGVPYKTKSPCAHKRGEYF